MSPILLNQTHDPQLKSWVESANLPTSDFPIQNLPFGIFVTKDTAEPHVGVAIGDMIVDLARLAEAKLLEVSHPRIFFSASLNPLIESGQHMASSIRAQLSHLLDINTPLLRDNIDLRHQVIIPQNRAILLLPVTIGGYTDFYSSKEHATNVGRMFRDADNPLLPNWLEMPIGYNGRASSVVVSGTPIRRPNGQVKLPDQARPVFSASQKLDIELEMGFVIGKNSVLGEPIACSDAEKYIFGMVLLNDWSARDIQSWEYVPLGPFNAKTFATSISPWVVTMEALAPFRVATPHQDPRPLPYLSHEKDTLYAVDIVLEAFIRPPMSQVSSPICTTNFHYLYWSMAQQLAHHTISGCNVRVGDLMGSGTISGPTPPSWGSLLELTYNGKTPVSLIDGGNRTFLQDGDEVTLHGFAEKNGVRVGFGTCCGTILPALSV